MIIIPPNHYCVIENPVVRNENGNIVIDQYGQATLRYTQLEIRLAGQPFPLYPGEIVRKNITPLSLISFNQALHLVAIRDVEIDDPQQCSHASRSVDEEKELNEPYYKKEEKERTPGGSNQQSIIHLHTHKELKKAGEEWYFIGPGHYVPNVSVDVIGTVEQIIIEPGTAIKLKAKRDLHDNYYQKFRQNGDIWLLKEPGPYLPHVYEQVLSIEKPYLITERTALHLRALRDFTDDYGVARHFGDEYLIDQKLTSSHLLNVNEEFVREVSAIVLNNRQFAIIEDPYSDKQNKFLLGRKKTVRGPQIFFLQPPYEKISGIADVIVLAKREMLVLTAKETFYVRDNVPYYEDEDGALLPDAKKKLKVRKSGDVWYIYGPGEYWPILEATYRKRLATFYLDDLFYIYHASNFILIVLLFVALCVAPRYLF